MVYNGWGEIIQWVFIHDDSLLPQGYLPDPTLKLLCLKSSDGTVNPDVLQCAAVMVKRYNFIFFLIISDPQGEAS